jgi:hypothetical protein
MPHLPDHHAEHDPQLVAAFAAGDAEGADLERAQALVAGCTECALLHHDLRAIASSMPSLPAPTRTRDFRLGPEQAAALRPSGWRRLLAPLGGPRFAFAVPLGGSLAALGLAGILVAGAASMPLPGTGTVTREQATTSAGAEGSQPMDVLAGSSSGVPAELPLASAAASAPAAGLTTGSGPAASAPPDQVKVAAPQPTQGVSGPGVAGRAGASPNLANDGDAVAAPVADEAPPSAIPAASPFQALAAGVLLTGVVLLVARFVGRRAV